MGNDDDNYDDNDDESGEELLGVTT